LFAASFIAKRELVKILMGIKTGLPSGAKRLESGNVESSIGTPKSNFEIDFPPS